MSSREKNRMPDISYRVMVATFRLIDFFFPFIERRVGRFGILPGMTVVDYGCGPGRYTLYYSRLVGPQGKVYAVDIHEMAIDLVNQMKVKNELVNVEPVLARGYASGLPDHIADVVTAIDMFFGIREPVPFLAELKRIAKTDGTLVIDDGHQARAVTLGKIAAAEGWRILEETKDHLKCKPLN